VAVVEVVSVMGATVRPAGPGGEAGRRLAPARPPKRRATRAHWQHA
jgi:hypothetical protein